MTSEPIIRRDRSKLIVIIRVHVLDILLTGPKKLLSADEYLGGPPCSPYKGGGVASVGATRLDPGFRFRCLRAQGFCGVCLRPTYLL